MGAITTVLIENMPALIQLGRDLFVKAHPDLPVPTNEEVIAAWVHAATSSLAKDEAWLAAHPRETPLDPPQG